MAPTIFIVPGIYEGPESFSPLVAALHARGIDKVVTTSLRSTDCAPQADGPQPTMDDDIAGIAADFRRVVDDAGPDGVLAVMHSAGGFLGSAAMEGLTAPARAKEGKEGGVKRIVFLCAALLEEQQQHPQPPFFEYDVSVLVGRPSPELLW